MKIKPLDTKLSEDVETYFKYLAYLEKEMSKLLGKPKNKKKGE